MRVVIFILLKITEIAAFVFVPYGLGQLVAGQEHPMGTWLIGALCLFMGVAILLIGIVLSQANWKWSKRIKDSFNRRFGR